MNEWKGAQIISHAGPTCVSGDAMFLPQTFQTGADSFTVAPLNRKFVHLARCSTWTTLGLQAIASTAVLLGALRHLCGRRACCCLGLAKGCMFLSAFTGIVAGLTGLMAGRGMYATSSFGTTTVTETNFGDSNSLAVLIPAMLIAPIFSIFLLCRMARRIHRQNGGCSQQR